MHPETTNKYLITALLLGLVFHGTTIFFTLESTYDALIHLFFASHYASGWFEPWSYSWYTGFTVMGYPPLVHQSIALFSFIGGLKFGLFSVALLAILLFITGVYRFSLVITANRKASGYAAILAVFSSSFVETLHIFGQLPSIIGISVLMHALPEIYLWLKSGKYTYLIKSFSLLAVTVTSHHVTPIFGMVFFIFPLIGMVLMDAAKDQAGSYQKVRLKTFSTQFLKHLRRILVFGFGSLLLIILCILPYWVNTKNNPITQVPIPHGSRDHFLEVTSSGLVFFLIPWGILLVFLPYLFYRYYSKRYLFFGLSLTLLTILGTGGTTPIPKAILGENAFNILTLDRFTLWASIMALPIFGEFCYRFAEGDLRNKLQTLYGSVYHRLLGGFLAGLFIFFSIFTMTLGYFRPSQPAKIKMLPIINFLNQDQHDHWRYLPLGFGDQMAWLSAQTQAMTVDGNYHSARRLPELTSRAVERLENSKFRGVEGIGSLQQFLTIPEKYHLKYVFSNDKFYDPLLFFCGWQRLRQLENGIMVWEKLNVPPIHGILPKDDVATSLKLLWGTLPLLTVIFAFALNIQSLFIRALKSSPKKTPSFLLYAISYQEFKTRLIKVQHTWGLGLALLTLYSLYIFYLQNDSQISPTNVVKAYFDALDFKEFERAYSYIDPLSKKNLDQFMLEVSVSDGLLSSYAKLNDIKVKIISKTDSTATATAITRWVTPLELADKSYELQLVKRSNSWHLLPMAANPDLPPDQFLAQNNTQFYNHGRRKISVQKTYHEDVLKQPELSVLEAKLVSQDEKYSIIGIIQNIDNVPADVVIKGTLYTNTNLPLTTYNAKDYIKHKLMPKETTVFRIDFEATAWIEKGSTKPEIYNPSQFTPVELAALPFTFDLHCAGNVVTQDLYKSLSVNTLTVKDNLLQGTLFNGGLQEITIPQLVTSYYDKKQNLIWVDGYYHKEGLRPQRKQAFSYTIEDISKLKVISSNFSNTYINGLPNTVVNNKDPKTKNLSFLPVNQKSFQYLKVEANAYIGSPQ
ncbi:hypothetical protein NBT05_07270 [Aquimarina sp. ERC-38]|uniref:hypothetical protein n=1 Tax=Aquimarina sp. ERC-38 TaxID=2949996 RepID=UPI002245764D|nr:hypothetical protein [Aquimarina sp. ERC-38]UZO82268.1 hypothetical protein NBT05_07270 [Aquimarina sp. ERC-38]